MPRPGRSLNIQVLHSVENLEIGEKTFAEVRGQVRKGIESDKANIQSQLNKLAETGAHKLREQYGVDAALKVSNTALLGYFEESPSALGFTMALKVQASGTNHLNDKVVVAALLTPVNGRLIDLHATGDYFSEEDHHWAEQSVSAWRNSILAANPRLQGPRAKDVLTKNLDPDAVRQGLVIVIGVALAAAALVYNRVRRSLVALQRKQPQQRY